MNLPPNSASSLIRTLPCFRGGIPSSMEGLPWFSELGTDEHMGLDFQWQMNPLMEEDHHSLEFNFQPLPSPADASSSSRIISFVNSSDSPPPSDGGGNLECVSAAKPKAEPAAMKHFSSNDYTVFDAAAVGVPSAAASNPKDHVMAERKRREKLSQHFIALSATVPGIKKTDKASVLGDAIKYMKQLQERVRALEAQARKRKVDSVVVVSKSRVSFCDGDGSLDGGCLPEIEVKVSEKNVLIRVHCEKRRGVVPELLAQVERLGVTVVNTSALPFGDHAMDVTLIAKMEGELRMTVKDLASKVRQAVV